MLFTIPSKPLIVTSCGFYRVDSGPTIKTNRPKGRRDYQYYLLFVLNQADDILKVHDSCLEEQTKLKILLVEKRETTNALNNLMGALEKGIVSRTTQQRLEELEAKLEDIEAKIIVEESKSKIHLTKEDILRFMKKALKKEPYAMVRMLVNKVILYNDKVEIYYNYIENYKPDDNNHQAFSFYKEYADIDIVNRAISTGFTTYNTHVELFV